ncbi:MAG: thiamine diphosphokinase [Paraclostridium sp.]
MKACIVLNGEVKDYEFLESNMKTNKYDFIICADGGARHLYKVNIVPDYILGDLDSLSYEIIDFYKHNKVKFTQFPSRKNETDAELCINLASDLNVDEIYIIGALGGRIDHTIANINLLYYIKQLGINSTIQTSDEDIFLVSNETSIINGNKGDTISIIPIKGDAKGVTLEYLEYPLNNFEIKYGTPIGISNVMEKNECKITVDEGSLIVIRNKKPV